MTTEITFTKIYAGNNSQQTAAELLQWFDARCQDNGLRPVASEAGAHCSIMVIASSSRWLHFSAMGHYLPEATDHYRPLPHLLSEQYPVVGYWGSDGGPYILRRFRDGQVTARYAVHKPGRQYESAAAAAPWNPILEDWRDLLADEGAVEDFYQLLPPPQHPESPTPTFSFDFFDLPEHFNRLFGWNPELNYASIEFVPDGPEGRGDFYEKASGDYLDSERDLRIFVRHYQHPTPNGYGVWAEKIR